MSFININNKQANPTATYSATVIREALLSVETKNTAKVDTLVKSIDHDLTLSEALEFFTAKLSAMNALNVALINEETQKEQDALEAKHTFTTAVNVIKLSESMMSEIDILAQEAKDLADFTKTFFKEYGDKIKKTADSMEWLEELYTSSITEALAINERSINKIQKEFTEVTTAMAVTVTSWKEAEGDTKSQLLDKLKSLTSRKKELIAELDTAVMGKDRDAVLTAVEESVVTEGDKNGMLYYEVAKEVLKDQKIKLHPAHIESMLDKMESDGHLKYDAMYTKSAKKDIEAAIDKVGKKELKSYVYESVVTEAKRAGLTKDETLKVAQKYADAIAEVDGVKVTVNMETLEEDSFDLDYDGTEFDGGSYNINADGSVVNMAVRKQPTVGTKDDDVKTIVKFMKKHYGKLAKNESAVNEAVKEVVLSNEILDFLEERGILKASDAQKVHKDLTAFLKEKGINESVVTEAFYRLSKDVIGDELYAASQNLTNFYDRAAAGNDVDAGVIDTIIKELNTVKKAIKKFNGAEEVKGTAYESTITEADNTEILDLVDHIHEIIKDLKEDSTKDSKKTSKLFNDSKPLIARLHSLVEGLTNEGKDDYVARYIDTNINLKKGYKHLNDEELNQIYLEIGELIADNKLKVKDATFTFEAEETPSWGNLIERINYKLNEDLRRDLKSYIKKNEDELNQLADDDNWDIIYNNLRGEFDIKEGTKEDKEMIETFRFLF